MTKSELIEIISAKQKHLAAKDVELAVKQIARAHERCAGHRRAHRDPRLRQLLAAFPPAAQGRNPKTGDAVALAGKYVPHFKPGKDLRERVNDGADQPIRD